MNDPIVIGDATLLAGDVREVLRGLPAESVHCCITSPPYWGLRAYGTEPQVWLNPSAPEGGWKAMGRCEHEWNAEPVKDKRGLQLGKAVSPDLRGAGRGDTCVRCGAWRGELGQEPTPALFVEHLVEVFREVRRVLRPDGTLWLNLGDSYASGKGTCFNPGGGSESLARGRKTAGVHPLDRGNKSTLEAVGLKPKDLCEIPSDVVRALRADGWWLRSRIPWLKRNAMPESTNDRPTQAVEYVFLLTKAGRYYYDGEAVKAGALTTPHHSGYLDGADYAVGPMDRGGHSQREDPERVWAKDGTRARRNSDWFFESWQGLYADDDGAPLAFIVNPAGFKAAHFATFPPKLVVNPAGFKAAHFATFPPKLVEPMVKAGTSEKGCCPKCGKPWERVVEKQASTMNIRVRDAKKGVLEDKSGFGGRASVTTQEVDGYGPERDGQSRTLGWHPGCECGGEPVPCIVLDPFSGAGTTAMVAAQLGRRAIGIDLSEKYNRMAATRIGKALNPLTFVDEDAEVELPLLTEKSP